MAFNVKLVSAVADVTDKMADEVFEKIVAVLADKFGAQMRG